jgi:hypothetical protein
MKFSAVVATIAIACVAVQADPGLAFSVKPSMLLNAAHVGYSTDNFFIGGGLEFASVSLSSEYTYEYPEGEEYTGKSKTDVSVFLPQVAARVNLMSIGGDTQDAGYARPFFGAVLFYSIATASITGSYGETTQHDTIMEKNVTDLLGGNIGGTVAFGGEYFIARALSLSGELGVRCVFGGASSEYEGYEYTYVSSEQLGLGFTYTALGLNFYF